MSRDYYETLGVSKASGDADIKKAYRTLAMQYHPDRNKGDKAAEAKFKEINEAYETLKDPQKKAAYDRYGHENYKSASNGGGGGFNNRGFSSNDFSFDSSSPFADIFEEFFNNRSERMDMRGADLRYETSVTLEEAFRGKNIDLKIKTNVSCKSCRGTGSEGGARPKTCPSCRGTGKMRFTQGFFMVERTCSACNGTGHIIENSCRECRGAGRVGTTKNISVTIPAGIEDGARIRLTGEGEAGIRGGSSGDLYIFVSVKPHRLFKREGSTISCDVPISMITAALGGDVEVPTIDGKKAIVKIPAGTQSGNIMKLRNRGMTVIRSALRGDMMIHARVETPVNLTKKQRELLEEFDTENNSHPQSTGFFSKVKEFWQEL